ncbi:hypothetical protein O3P69_004633 [Scylla paramamosain]|uniref:Uncharacterized protein n=1 Tax=Scylla paramamosain TaxID=85552 RepID=A0AAW0UAG6_SCYPA
MDWFPENLGSMSDEQRERFHQDIKQMDTRDAPKGWHGRWDRLKDVPDQLRGRPGVSDSGGMQTPPPSSWTDRQFVVIASEKVAWLVSLSTQNCVFKQILTDVFFVVNADMVTIKGLQCPGVGQRFNVGDPGAVWHRVQSQNVMPEYNIVLVIVTLKL